MNNFENAIYNHLKNDGQIYLIYKYDIDQINWRRTTTTKEVEKVFFNEELAKKYYKEECKYKESKDGSGETYYRIEKYSLKSYVLGFGVNCEG